MKEYPRIYSLDARTGRGLDAIAVAPLVVFIAIDLLKLAGIGNKAPIASDLLAMGSLAGLALLVISRTHRRVILYEDGIEVVRWF